MKKDGKPDYMRENLVIAIPIHFAAWVMILLFWSFEPLNGFLLPNVNNTPAFLTLSQWAAQSLLVMNLVGCLIQKVVRKFNGSVTEWKFSAHLIFTIVHILAVGALTAALLGFEDL
ncbi:hypothetical protein N6H14_02790 [Paenibacillus sp. CC-CFT747]|nr:hypothetical protein N6H14_02790 [Paenibacillus sp. CC-CFT747]